MFDEIYTAVRQATDIEDLKNRLEALKTQYGEFDINMPSPNFPPLCLAGQLAYEGLGDKAELLIALGADLTDIAAGYFKANNHIRLEEFRTKHANSIDLTKLRELSTEIVVKKLEGQEVELQKIGSQLNKNKENNEEFKSLLAKNGADIDDFGVKLRKFRESLEKSSENIALIIKGIEENESMLSPTLPQEDRTVDSELGECLGDIEILREGHQEAVNELQQFGHKNEKFGAEIEAFGDALIGAEEELEEVKKIFTVSSPTNTKESTESSPPVPPAFPEEKLVNPVSSYSNSISILKEFTENSKDVQVANSILNSIYRLKEGQESWNPYWMNSREKLELIIKAVCSLSNNSDLNSQVKDENSALYKALNFQRISPFTFFGKLGFDQAKSLIAAQECLPKEDSIKL